MESLIIAGVLVLIAILIVFSTIKIIPQAQAGIVERLGRYNRTLDPGLTIIIPFIDRLRPLIDLREQVVSFAPQPVITSDNLVVSIDSVIYFQVTDAKAATYEIQSYLQGVEQLTVTTLRNVVGSLDLEETLTSRDNINAQLRGVLDEATGKWGIRVNRVELKAIDPPASVQQSMEKQMRADRDKRAAILSAEGSKQAAILEAEGGRTAAILKAEGQAQAQVLRAQGEAEAIAKVFNAINSGHATDQVMAYQYLQSLPLLAQGTANKVFVIPAELSGALGAVTRAFAPGAAGGAARRRRSLRRPHQRRTSSTPIWSTSRPRSSLPRTGHRLIPVGRPGHCHRSRRPTGPGLHRAHGCGRAIGSGAGRGTVHRRGREGDPARAGRGVPAAVGADRAEVAAGPGPGPARGPTPRSCSRHPRCSASVTGYRVHRGALASFERRPLAAPAELVADARFVVVLVDLVDHTNVGAIFRNAAALGADAVLVTPGCADPLYRRSVKVSMGAVLGVPWTRTGDDPLAALEGFTTIAMTLDPDATEIGRRAPGPGAQGRDARHRGRRPARGPGRPGRPARAHPHGRRGRLPERGCRQRDRPVRPATRAPDAVAGPGGRRRC